VDLVLLEQLSVIGGSVLAALIGMEQQLFSLDLTLALSSVEGLDHQSSIHPLIELPADHSATEQIDPHRQLTPAGFCADVGDVACPAAVWFRWLELLLLQVVRHTMSSP
jgi:hypothetical protein